ncbi:IS3 family transposase [Eubacterium multiforme]|uniref:IS3 family transposase n=1 Tax=Eubacterium multiforme TaxID=83339 RepID=UPI0035212532
MLHIFKAHNGNYGSKRISEELSKNGIYVNRKRITRLMGIMNLYPKRTKYSYKTYKKNFSNIKHQNLLKELYESNENL